MIPAINAWQLNNDIMTLLVYQIRKAVFLCLMCDCKMWSIHQYKFHDSLVEQKEKVNFAWIFIQYSKMIS